MLKTMTDRSIRKTSFQWHQKLVWLALIGLLMFVISAATHPILSWTGPKAATFRPPTSTISAQQINAVAGVLKRHNIERARVVKVVPSAQGNVLQVTGSNTQANTQPRRYFDLSTGNELPGFDEQHAIWLARYYLGSNSGSGSSSDTELPIKKVTFKTEFDAAYPWVNRLLPVYRVEFADKANTSAYVYTEINALAGMGNDYNTRMQAVFRALHTWSWLEGVEYARILIMGILLVCIFLMCLTGIGLLLLLRGRKRSSLKNKVHRISAYVVAIPLLGFCISGFLHLLHYGLNDTHRGMVPPAPLNLTHLTLNNTASNLPTTAVNHASLVSYKGNLYYRLSLPNTEITQAKPQQNSQEAHDEHAHHQTGRAQRNQRYKGQASEQGGHYIAVNKQHAVSLNDQVLAEYLASQHLGLPQNTITSSQIIKRFGRHYDFRNKRLPVWQIDFDSELGDKLFIDPATGTIVDRLVDHDRYEGYSFSFLHKWNFLTSFTGRFWRDVIVVALLALTLLLSLMGVLIKLKR